MTESENAPKTAEEQIAELYSLIERKKTESWWSRLKWPKFEWLRCKFNQDHVAVLIVLACAVAIRWALYSQNPQVIKISNILIAIGSFYLFMTLDGIFFRSQGFDTNAHIANAPYGVVLRWGFHVIALAILLGLVIGGTGI